MMSDRPRLTVNLSTRLSDTLNTLSTELEISKANVLRLGLELLVAMLDAKREGFAIGAWLDNPAAGTRREREFIIRTQDRQE